MPDNPLDKPLSHRIQPRPEPIQSNPLLEIGLGEDSQVDTTPITAAAFDHLYECGRGVHGQTLLKKRASDRDDPSGK